MRPDDRRTAGPSPPALYLPSPGSVGAEVHHALARAGLAVTPARNLAEALRLSAEQPFEACVADLSGGRPALVWVRALGAERPDLPIVLVLDPHHPVISRDDLPVGVVEVLPWPFEAHDIAVMLANLRDRAGVDVPLSNEVGEPVFDRSPAMRYVMDRLRANAGDRTGACLCGERGSGRKLVARTLHHLDGDAATRPFAELDCAVAPAELDRRLFGVAGEDRSAGSAPFERIGPGGALVSARGGTLLLTNLTEMPARMQARLARLLRDREVQIGSRGREIVELDVRLMAAVDPHVDDQVREGELRADLYERLSQLRVDVPPLRRRREDIPALAAHCLRAVSVGDSAAPRRFSRSALALLSALPWPGNGTELRQLIESLGQSVRRAVIQIDDLLERASLDGVATRLDTGVSLRDAKTRFERECISAVLLRHHGRVGEAARALGIQRTNLYRKVRQLNVARSLLSARR